MPPLRRAQVMQAQQGYGFALADASSICLKDCPLLNNNVLNWVCYYPSDVNASSWASASSVRGACPSSPTPRADRASPGAENAGRLVRAEL